MPCRFAKPKGLFEPRHTASSRAADSEQQRWSHSEAAAQGKGYEVCCPPCVPHARHGYTLLFACLHGSMTPVGLEGSLLILISTHQADHCSPHAALRSGCRRWMRVFRSFATVLHTDQDAL